MEYWDNVDYALMFTLAYVVVGAVITWVVGAVQRWLEVKGR